MLYGLFIGVLTFWLLSLGLGLLIVLRRKPKAPRQEAAAIERALFHPTLLAMMMALAIMLPLVIRTLGGLFSHGHAHGADVLHQFAAFPEALSNRWLWLSISLLSVIVLWAWLPPLRAWLRVRLRLRRLRSVGGAQEPRDSELSELTGDYHGEVLLVPGAWAGLAGLIKPVLLLGRDLTTSLNRVELRGVIAHEEAHRRRRDPLKRFLLLLLGRLIPLLGPRLLKRWQGLTELLCDGHAGQTTGEPLLVASALLKTHRLQDDSWTSRVLVGFPGVGRIEDRINALLALELSPSANHTVPPKASILPVLLMIAAALALAYPAHCLLEFLFSLIL